MNTIDESDLITWAHTDPTPEQLRAASDMADELSDAAFDAIFSEHIKTSREKALLIVALLWPTIN